MAWLLSENRVLCSAEVLNGFFMRAKGLLGKSKIQGAYVFTRTKSIHTFFMRFPIDVAFCDKNNVVVEIKSVKPFRLALGSLRTKYIIEAEEGSFERWGLIVGMKLDIQE